MRALNVRGAKRGAGEDDRIDDILAGGRDPRWEVEFSSWSSTSGHVGDLFMSGEVSSSQDEVTKAQKYAAKEKSKKGERERL